MYLFFHLHFLYNFIFLPKEKKTKHKKGRQLIGALRQITLLGIKMYHMMSKQIRKHIYTIVNSMAIQFTNAMTFELQT